MVSLRIRVPGTKENAPSLYTVIRLRSDIMSVPTDITSEGSRRDRVHDESRTFPKNSPSLPQAVPKKHGFKKPSTSFQGNDDHIFLKHLQEQCISEERRQFILKFNDYARSHSHALLPITSYSPELDKALDAHEDYGFEDLSSTIEQEVKDFDGPADKRLTLVRIAWDNY